MKYIKIWFICILVFTYYNTIAQQVKKQDIKVLFVGDPSEEKGTRFPAFKNYLELYFTGVKAVDAKEYKSEMSADFDVTIFDKAITPFKKEIRERRDDGTMLYEPARYLTEDFDDAVIFIGQAAPQMGKTIGLKLDWLCLCLHSDAHHIKTDHPIFKGPFDVELTFENKPTPENIYLFASGQNVPKQIPMWRVQSEVWDVWTEGGEEKFRQNFRVGMVSRGDGFSDSPDAEYISSGVNSKDVGAVAIGRHGNFFMWGFTGSPNHMTDEAKQVFANAVVYMKQFKGKKPVARKYNERIVVRDARVDYMLFRLSDDGYEMALDVVKKENAKMVEKISLLKKKMENGKQLTEPEQKELNATPLPLSDFEQYLKNSMSTMVRYVKDSKYSTAVLKNETNIEAFRNFLKENREYMYVQDGSELLEVDEDARQLGISNRDIKILYKAVELLEKASQTELANRILNRYTKERFSSPKEWKLWLDKNKSNLFFTDAGGYVWLVNEK